MSEFVRADIIKIKKDMEVIEKEIKELKEKYTISELKTLFYKLLTTLGDHCMLECKVFKCSKCRVGLVISLIEQMLMDLEKLRILEFEYLKLFNEYAEYVIEETEKDIEEIKKEVLDYE